MAKLNGAVKSGDVHVMFTAKGGVGKTHISSLIGQYSQSVGKPVNIIDLDQSNPMLARIPELNAEEVSLLTEGAFDDAKLDALVRKIGASEEPFLMDFGASTYQFAWKYFMDNGISETFLEWGKRLVYHAVVTGGPELPYTLASFEEVARVASKKQVVVWINPIKGPVASEGKSFTEMSVFLRNKEKVLAVGLLPTVDRALSSEFERLALLERSMLNLKTVPELDVLSRNRLQRHRDKAFDVIKSVMELVDADA